MSTSYTIGLGTTVSHELIITNADGTRSSINNLGVLNVTTTVAGSTLLYGILAQPAFSDVLNSGTLLDTNTSAKAAVAIQYSGYVLNNPGDTIGGPIGVYFTGIGPLNIHNKGSIFGTGGTLSGAGEGIRLEPSSTGNGSGQVNNYQGATISGASYGIVSGNKPVSVANVGLVTAYLGGIFLQAGGYIHQPAKYGTISAKYAVAINGATGTVVNSGTITGDKLGVGLGAGGTVTNLAPNQVSSTPGTITGSKAVTIVGGPGTVINGGFINGRSAAGTAVALAAGFTNRVEIVPGASFIGTINGGNTVGATSISTLQLTTGSSAGSIGGIGSKYTNFSTITIDASAAWTLTGSNSIASGLPIGDAGTVTNAGLLQGGIKLGAAAQLTNAGTATITGSVGVTGSGGPSTVVNSGLISNPLAASGAYGVSLANGGTITNQAGGVISATAGSDAILVSGTIGAVTNRGSIAGDTQGVRLVAGGVVTNAGTGKISGGIGIDMAGPVQIVDNQATVQSTNDGVYATGGNITNEAGAVISAGRDPVDVKTGAATVINSGKMTAVYNSQNIPGGSGVALYDGGSVTNKGTGSISGLFGVYITGASGGVVNASTITGFGFPAAVGLLSGGSVGNQAGGYLRGNFGISIAGGGGSVNNAGFVTGFTDGVVLSGSGYVSNTGTGAIYSGVAVSISGGKGTVTNAAKISGGSVGVTLAGGGSVNNQTGASIGGTAAVLITGGAGTVHNAATIAAASTSGTAVSLLAGVSNLVTMTPGATFVGTVNGGNTIGATSVTTLELGAGAPIGPGFTASYITGFGSKYVNFGSVAIDPGSYWDLASGGTVPSGVVFTDNGSMANFGVMLSNPTLATAAALLFNAQNASITGANNGVLATAALAKVVNYGIIRGTAGVSYGVHFTDGGTVTNASHGTITAATAIYIGGAVATMVNHGQMLGSDTHDFEIFLSAGGTIQNLGGTIDGGSGVDIEHGPATVVNAGKIAAEDANPVAISLAQGFADQLTIAPGAVFGGKVDGGNPIGTTAISTLVMTTGNGAGTIGGIGTQYYNFTGFTVASGATWNVTGTNTIGTGGSLFVAGTAINQGAFQGRISVTGGGLLSNAGSGSITTPVLGVGGPATVINQGSIVPANTSLGSGGILLSAGGAVSNAGTGSIFAARYGVSIVASGASVGTVGNRAGIVATGSSIAGGNVYGVALKGGGTITNYQGGGIIANAAGYGVFVSEGLGTVFNQGLITDEAAGGLGVMLTAGGTVVNDANGGVILGANGVQISGAAGTVSNYGAIVETAPAGFAVYLPVGFANRLIDHPTASFVGQVNGGNTIGGTAVSTLELGTGGQQGILTGLGAQFANFASVVVDPAALWSFQGQNSLAAGAALLDQGSLALNGELTVDGTVTNAAVLLEVADTGDGRLVVENQGSLVSSGSAQSMSGLQITQTNGLSGDVLVTGARSLLSNAGRFLVGNSGVGSLEVEAGGTVVTTPFTGEDGLVVANISSASGSSVDVTGFGSTLQVGGSLVVGLGGIGGLSVTGGATVSTDALDAGVSAAAAGQVSVSGAATSLTVGGAATVADDGSGVLSVLNGATFAAASLTIGSQGDSSGAVVVSGAGSVIQLSGALNVGTALGTGDLTVGPGAVVNASVINLQGGVVLEGGLLDPTVFIENGGSTTGGFGTVSSQFILLEGTILSNGSKSGKETEVVQGTVVGGGTATINGSVSINGPGILQIGTHDTIELTGAVLNVATTTFIDNLTPAGTYSVNNSVIDLVFQDSTGVLQLDDIAGFAGTVATWKTGDSFVITGGTLSGLGVSNGDTLTFSDAGTGAGAGGIDSIIFGSAISAGGFTIVNGNTVQAVACFAEGTRIRTATEWVAVENMRVGDRAITIDGANEPIVWIGQRTVNCKRHPAPETVWPVLISAGAFGDNGPVRDLYLSPDHAVFVAGVLVPVKLLINGDSITQVRRDQVAYFHVELPEHAVILAEELPVESFLSSADRGNFQEDGKLIRLFPDFARRVASETALAWETRGVAPLAIAGEALERARGLVAAHASREARWSGARPTAPKIDPSPYAATSSRGSTRG